MELEIRCSNGRTAKEFNGLIGFVDLGNVEPVEPITMRALLRPKLGMSAIEYAEIRIREFWDGVRQPKLVIDSSGRGTRYWSRVTKFRFPVQDELDEERRLYPKILEARELA